MQKILSAWGLYFFQEWLSKLQEKELITYLASFMLSSYYRRLRQFVTLSS